MPLNMFLYPQVGLRCFLVTASSLLNFSSFWYQEPLNVAGCHGNGASRSYRRAHRGDGVDDCSVVKEERQMLEAASRDCWKLRRSSKPPFGLSRYVFASLGLEHPLLVLDVAAAFRESMFYLNPDVATMEKMSVNHQSRHLACSDISAKLLCQYIC